MTLNNSLLFDKLLEMNLENISLIASIICALTSITTSLRAVGTAREYSRDKEGAKLQSCRISSHSADAPSSQRSSLKLHLIVTIIWFVLSLVFIYPLFMQRWTGTLTYESILFIISFLLLGCVLILIWRKVMHFKG